MTTAAVRAAPAMQSAGYIVPLDEATLPELVGGKAHNLCRISALGLRVPSGFVVTAHAFESHLEENDLAARIRALPQWQTRSLPGELGLASERQLSARIRDLIVNTPLSPKLCDSLASAAEALLSRGPVVVRSSAVGEDSARASFAGQLDSFLHIRTLAGLESALLACWASCWSHARDRIPRRARVGSSWHGCRRQKLVDALARRRSVHTHRRRNNISRAHARTC